MQEIEDALATPGTARVFHGKIRRLVIDEVEIPLENLGVPRQRRYSEAHVMSGSNMGKTDMLRRLAGDYTREEVDAAMQRFIDADIEELAARYTAAMGRVAEAAAAASTSVREFTLALSRAEVPGLYGPSPLWGALEHYTNPLVMIHPTEPDARRFAVAHLEPLLIDDTVRAHPCSFDDFMAGMVDSIAGTFDIPREALLLDLPGGKVTDGAGIMRQLMRNAPRFGMRPAEPRPKRDRRNRGPAKHGKWWNK